MNKPTIHSSSLSFVHYKLYIYSMYATAILFAVLCLSLVASLPAQASFLSTSSIPSRTYSTITGFFLQDDAGTDDSTFDPVNLSLGLEDSMPH